MVLNKGLIFTSGSRLNVDLGNLVKRGGVGVWSDIEAGIIVDYTPLKSSYFGWFLL